MEDLWSCRACSFSKRGGCFFLNLHDHKCQLVQQLHGWGGGPFFQRGISLDTSNCMIKVLRAP
eukprot:1982070-Pyramimonas_sp.AAC.1